MNETTPTATDPTAPIPSPAPQTSTSRMADGDPPLLVDRGFWGMAVTQFLGAFNDNVFKQLILLLATPAAVVAIAGQGEGVGEVARDRQGEATILFALAFVMFSGFAGWLADRTSKRTLIVWAKVAEIGVMLLGMVGFFFYDQIGLNGMFFVLFLMGVQSAFFGPPKYGILPEKVRPRDLPAANGIFLMFTFVAIIFGMVLAGLLIQWVGTDNVWRASAVCVGIAVLGTATSILVWRVPPAAPGSRLRLSDLFVPGEMIRLLGSNRQLLLALSVTSMFWMLGSVVQPAVNALGKTQLGLSDGLTSLLAAMMAVGIPIGCVVGGYLSKRRINPRIVAVGAAGMFVCLVLMSIPGGAQGHWLGFAGSIPVLLLLGFFTGMFIVPIQVSIQVLPPPEDKGRMIAMMNQCNFLGIIFGGLIFKAAIGFLEWQEWPRNLVFAITAAIMLPIALAYRPEERELS